MAKKADKTKKVKAASKNAPAKKKPVVKVKTTAKKETHPKGKGCSEDHSEKESPSKNIY